MPTFLARGAMGAMIAVAVAVAVAWAPAAAQAAPTVTTDPNVIAGTASGGPPGSVTVGGTVHSIDCTSPYFNNAGVGFDYATDASYSASGGSYDQFQYAYHVSNPQGVSGTLGSSGSELTVGTVYHFRAIAWCGDGYSSSPAGQGPVGYGEDRTFVCCESSSGGGGGDPNDKTPPTIAIWAPSYDQLFGMGTPTFYGPAGTESGDASSVQVRVYMWNGSDWDVVRTQTVQRRDDGYWVATPDPELGDGTYDLEVVQSDAAGNVTTTPRVRFRIQHVQFFNVGRQATMPKVVKLTTDNAIAKIERAGITNADYEFVLDRKSPPAGIQVGEIVSQKPAPATRVTTGPTSLSNIALRIYAGPNGGGCAMLTRNAAEIRQAGFEFFQELLTTTRCGVNYNVRLTRADDAGVSGFQAFNTKKVNAAVTCPKETEDQDLFFAWSQRATRGEQFGFGADDWALTKSDSEGNLVSAVVIDRSGRFVQNVKVAFDLSDVGGKDPPVMRTDSTGFVFQGFIAPRAGKIDVCAWGQGRNGKTIYGASQLKVVNRDGMDVGKTFDTVGGRRHKRTRTGFALVSSIATARNGDPLARAAISWDGVVDWFRSWLGDVVGSVLSGSGSPQERVRRANQEKKASMVQLGLGQPLSGNAERIALKEGKLIGVGAGNLIGVGAGNLIGVGAGNLIGVGAGNLIGVGAGNLIGVGAGNAAPGPVDIEKVNVVEVEGHLVGVGAGNLIGVGAGNLIGVGAGNVIAVGAGNLIGVGAGN